MVLLGVLPALLIIGLLVGGTWAGWLASRPLPRPPVLRIDVSIFA